MDALINISLLLWSFLVSSSASVVVVAPHFLSEPRDVEVRLGHALSLHCHATGAPKPAVKWYFNGHPVSERGEVIERRLRISKFTTHDAGVYYCNATNEEGSIVSRRATVRYHGLSGHFERDPVSHMWYRDPESGKLASGTAVFNCTLHRRRFTTVPTIIWHRFVRNKSKAIGRKENGQSQSHRSGRFYHFQSGMTSYLQITNPRQSDIESSYRCVATHPQLPGVRVLSRLANLSSTNDRLYGGFGLTQQPSNVTVTEFDDVTLGCAFRGDILHHGWESSLTGFKTSFELNNDTTIWRRVGLYNVHKRNVKKNDEGRYWCVGQSRENTIKQSAVAYLSVLSNPVIVRHLPRSVAVVVGQTMILSCEVGGALPSQLTWLKNGVPLELVRSRVTRLTNGSLSVSPLNKMDGGMYQCIVKNSAGNTHSSTHVTVLYPATAIGPSVTVTIEEQQNVTLPCTADWNPLNITFHWKKLRDNATNDRRFTILSNGHLRILDVELDDGGEYECIPENDVGTERSTTIVLKVQPKAVSVHSGITSISFVSPGNHPNVEATLRLNPAVLVVNASDRALLYCDANIPSLLLNVTWRFMNDELPESMIVSDNGTLTIESTSKEHTGTYSCTVYHRTRAVTAEAAVVVQYSPKFEKPIERQVNVYEGQNVRLECHTDAVPVANVSWIKDDSRLSRNVEVKENLAVMTLEKATREVEGDYICLAENALGRHQQVVSVSVTEGKTVTVMTNSQTHDMYIIIGAVMGAVVTVAVLVAVVIVASKRCQPNQREYNVQAAEEKHRPSQTSQEKESYTKTYYKTYPPLEADPVSDKKDTPPIKYLPRTYSVISTTSSGFSSNLNIPESDADPRFVGYVSDAEVSSFKYDSSWKRHPRLTRSYSQPSVPMPSLKKERRASVIA